MLTVRQRRIIARSIAGLPALFAISLGLTAGCADTTGSGRFSVMDSAGVSIARSAAPAWNAGNGQGWTVDPSAVLAGGREPVSFERIAAIAPLGDGRFAVADAGDSTVLFFDAAGEPIRVIRALELSATVTGFTSAYRTGGRLFVSQRGLEPTLVFDLDGNFIETVQPPRTGLQLVALYRIMHDGAFVALQPPTGLLPRRGVWTESARFVRIDVDGSTRTIASVPGVRFARVSDSVEPVGFGPVLAWAITADRIHAAFPITWDIATWTADGRLIRRIRRDWQPIPVPAAAADSLRSAIRTRLESVSVGPPGSSESDEWLERSVSEIVIADSFPAHGRIIADDAGNLWIERIPPTPSLFPDPHAVRSIPTPYDVFDPDGRWLGTVDLPPDVWVSAIGDHRVLGILRIDGQPDHVVVHRINERAPPSLQKD